MKFKTTLPKFSPIEIVIESLEEAAILAVAIGNISDHDRDTYLQQDYNMEVRRADHDKVDSLYHFLEKQIKDQQ